MYAVSFELLLTCTKMTWFVVVKTCTLYLYQVLLIRKVESVPCYLQLWPSLCFNLPELQFDYDWFRWFCEHPLTQTSLVQEAISEVNKLFCTLQSLRVRKFISYKALKQHDSTVNSVIWYCVAFALHFSISRLNTDLFLISIDTQIFFVYVIPGQN